MNKLTAKSEKKKKEIKMENERKDLEIAKLIGEPINYQLPVPAELTVLADIFTAEAGEHVWRYSDVDTSLDTIINVDVAGAITLVKKTPLDDVELTFQGLNSKMEYVLVEAVLNSPDTQILGRRKESITRGMDKAELKAILDGIIASTSAPASVSVPAVAIVSGDDLYDVIMKAKHLVEDYGDDLTLMAGSTVKEAIDTYDKDQATSFNYNVTLNAKLAELGIKVVKVFGTVERTDGGGALPLLDAKKAILVARNSRVAEGRPVKFVRRKINPAIAKQMGADVDTAQRAIIVGTVPTVVAGTNTLAYSVFGYESNIQCITNPKALVNIDLSTIV